MATSVTPQAINGIDMHAMVKQLRQEKSQHERGIDRMTLTELREKVSNLLDLLVKNFCFALYRIANATSLA